MTDTIFRSPQHLRAAFVDGLEAMLAEHQGLGVFILVLANATYDEAIYQRLSAPLRERFEELASGMRSTLKAGRLLQEAPDDVLVFLKLIAVGFDALDLTQFRKLEQFELQFNPLRAYRPARMSDMCVDVLQQPFDEKGFHFNKPFLRKEIFWSGELQGKPCRLLYNKFPFAQSHGLLVIEPEQNKPQWLSEEDHLTVWAIAKSLGDTLEGVGFGYNAYGAFSSVNHQHLQMFVRTEGAYPVEHARWQHNGGEEFYPIACRRFEAPEAAWEALQQQHQSNRPYNLLYRPGCLYLLSRNFQGSYAHSAWTSGFAWAETCGAVTTFNADDFQGLDDGAIREEMARLMR